MKKITMQRRISGAAIGIATITFALAFSINTWIARELARDSALENAGDMARAHANAIAKDFMQTFAVANSLNSAVKALKGSSNPDRVAAQEIAKEMLERNPQLIGLSSYWEPDAFDGKDLEWADKPGHDKTGRLMAYWNRGSGKIDVEPAVDYDSEEKAPWYFVPKKTGSFYITDPYPYTIAGKEVQLVSLLSPIMVDGKFVGVVGSDYPLATIQDLVAQIKPYASGYGALITQTGIYASNPDSQKIGKAAEDVSQEILNDIKIGKRAQLIDGAGWVHIYEPVRIGTSDVNWSLRVSFPLDSVMAGARKIMTISVILTVSALFILGVVLIPLMRGITRPIVRLTETMHELAKGQGDLTKQLPVTSRDEIGQISSAFNAFMGKLRELISEVASQSGQIEEAAQVLEGNGREIADRSNGQLDASVATATAMKEIATSISLVADSAGGARASVDEMNALTRQAQTQLSETVQDIVSINESMQSVSHLVEQLDLRARDIGSITAVINDIAGQTNLLALNAAIEAARAGEQGRGFAVVADEVRKLAERTAVATNEISDKLTIIQGDTTKAVTSVGSAVERVTQGVERSQTAAGSIEGIATAAGRLVEQIGDIDAAAHEQHAATNDVARRLADISALAQENDASVQSNVEASQGLRAMAGNLQMLVQRFRI
ncbi:MAG: methyl-accepting chemotaxis protein [Propionivibrio sp.]